MLTIFITIIHVLVSLFLILVVLAQQGKGQDLASAFGGTGSQTAFGARGTATLLSKITAGAAILFMVTSLALSYLRPAVSGDTVIPASTTPAEPSATEGAESGEPDATAETEPATTPSGDEGENQAEPASEEPPPQQ